MLACAPAALRAQARAENQEAQHLQPGRWPRQEYRAPQNLALCLGLMSTCSTACPAACSRAMRASASTCSMLREDAPGAGPAPSRPWEAAVGGSALGLPAAFSARRAAAALRRARACRARCASRPRRASACNAL